MITDQELYVLSFYRASELAGAVLFGRLALHTDIAEFRTPLTEHCAEEARHAQLLTQLIEDLGHTPVKVKAIYQTEMARTFGMPTSAIEILALTQVFEQRVLQHYQAHAAMPRVNPKVAATLTRMIEDEYGHIDWVAVELQRYRDAHGTEGVDQAMERARSADLQAHAALTADKIYTAYFGELV